MKAIKYQEVYRKKFLRILEKTGWSLSRLAIEMGFAKSYMHYIYHDKRKIGKRLAYKIDFFVERLNLEEFYDQEYVQKKNKHPKDSILARLYHRRRD